MGKRGIRGKTITQSMYPITDPEYANLAQWPENFSTLALEFVWQGYDQLMEKLANINISQANRQMELNISRLLEARIRDSMTGCEDFYVQHEVPEDETSHSDKAQPPTYDIAFIWRKNETIMFPLEAKVLHSDGEVAKYIKEINENFLTCRYAPFSSEGGMLGYLLNGSPDKAFKNIEKKTPCTLSDNPDFPKRHHKISDHQRSVPESKSYPLNFRCHHLILQVIK